MRDVVVRSGEVELPGFLGVPEVANGLVVFAHGGGGSRFSNRNRYIADVLNRAGVATLLFDLLTTDEYRTDASTAQLRFDMGLLADRVTGAVDWVTRQSRIGILPVGLFGSDTGGAAVLATAAERAERVRAVVLRSGRPDLAGNALPWVKAPTLFIVGDSDVAVVELNRHAATFLRNEHRIALVPGAGHEFEEPGALPAAAALAREWFIARLTEAASG